MQRLVRPVVVPAQDVRDPEVDVVDHSRKLIRRGAVVAQERDPVEPRAEFLPRFAVEVVSLALARRPLVRLDPEPLEVLEDRVFPARHVPRGIGVVDPQQHPVADSAVCNRAQRVADVQRARGTGRKADACGHASDATR